MINQTGNTWHSLSHAADNRSMVTRSESSITPEITSRQEESSARTEVVFYIVAGKPESI